MSILLLTLVLAGIAWWVRLSCNWRDIWSISFYAGDDPLHMKPHPATQHPLLTAGSVDDVHADFVADPFLFRRDAGWYLFFEVLESGTYRGVIGYATSPDAISWRYGGIVLRESFHLSYPQVFESQGIVYMIPETGEAQSVRLYRARSFPAQWEFVSELVAGAHWDATIQEHEGHWWLFAMDDTGSLRLYRADALRGPWKEHPASPIVRSDLRRSRPGGRMIRWQGGLYRLAQDGVPTYGSSLRVLQVDELTPTAYREHELPNSPLLTGSGQGWNRNGMHHMDVQQMIDGSWIACVDGNRRRPGFNGRAGARHIVNTLRSVAKRGVLRRMDK